MFMGRIVRCLVAACNSLGFPLQKQGRRRSKLSVPEAERTFEPGRFVPHDRGGIFNV
jgi:hypothetical protein